MAPLSLHRADPPLVAFHRQAYISFIKATFQPKMTQPAEQILARYYQMQRQADMRNMARTTIRLLESLIRISEAHARLMFRDEVLVVDAVVAVTLIESSMQSSALLGATSALHSAFPRDPQEEYAIQGREQEQEQEQRERRGPNVAALTAGVRTLPCRADEPGVHIHRTPGAEPPGLARPAP